MAIIDYSKTRFEIGQIVALRFQGNRARYEEKGENGYKLGNITKIGRKYLTIDESLQINVETGYNKTQYSPDYQLFASEEDLLNQLERERNIMKIKSLFQYRETDLTNEQLNKIIEIVNQ